MLSLFLLIALFGAPGLADDKVGGPAEPDVEAAISTGIARIIERQEGAAWPYEGVYRLRGSIPTGYRVGGTSLCLMAVGEQPGLDEDAARAGAVQRAIADVIAHRDDEDMGAHVSRTYDVRGWGWAYGVMMIARSERAGLLPEPLRSEALDTARDWVQRLEATEIPGPGGWAYARRAGFDKSGPASPFMTASTLLALYEAAAAGIPVDANVIARGLNVLEAARDPTGAVRYSGMADGPSSTVPGATGRMLASECALILAGRGGQDRLRGAIDAFFVHWDWLELRRAQTGTHVAPYGIAPYYVMYAHLFAAMAIELLDSSDRSEYRRRLRELLFRTRADDGTWNDRVFDRSAAYGTAMAVMALQMPERLPPAPWSPEE